MRHPEEKIDAAAARFDGGDPVGAAEELMASLNGWLPKEFTATAPRILAGELAVKVATAAG